MTPLEGADAGPLVAILAMAAATYAMRAGGFWLMSHVTLTRAAAADARDASRVGRGRDRAADRGARRAVPPCWRLPRPALVMLVRRNDLLAVITGMAVAAAAARGGLVTGWSQSRHNARILIRSQSGRRRMRTATILGAALSIWVGPAFAQGSPPRPCPWPPAKPPAGARRQSPRSSLPPSPRRLPPPNRASTPASRSAAELAASRRSDVRRGHLSAHQGSAAELFRCCRCAAAGRPCRPTPSSRPAPPAPTSRCCATASPSPRTWRPKRRRATPTTRTSPKPSSASSSATGWSRPARIGPQTLAALNVPIAKRIEAARRPRSNGSSAWISRSASATSSSTSRAPTPRRSPTTRSSGAIASSSARPTSPRRR